MRSRTNLCVAIALIVLALRAAHADEPLQTAIDEFKVSAIPVADAIATLQEKSRQNIVVNWNALKTKQIDLSTPITVGLTDATLEQVMLIVCASLDPEQKLGITFTDEDGVVYLSTKDDIKQRGEAKPLPARGDEAAAEQTDELLNRRMPEINFNQTGVSDVLEFVKDITQLDIQVNWDALEKAGIKTQSPVTVRVRDLSLRRTLRLVLENLAGDPDAKLDYVVDGDHILISTRDDLMKK